MTDAKTLLIALLLVVMAADCVTTNYALSLGFTERNPFMVDVVESPEVFVAVKLVGVAAIIGLAHWTDRKWHGSAVYMLGGATLCWYSAALWNIAYVMGGSLP
jgi:hypothetical protein